MFMFKSSKDFCEPTNKAKIRCPLPLKFSKLDM